MRNIHFPNLMLRQLFDLGCENCCEPRIISYGLNWAQIPRYKKQSINIHIIRSCLAPATIRNYNRNSCRHILVWKLETNNVHLWSMRHLTGCVPPSRQICSANPAIRPLYNAHLPVRKLLLNLAAKTEQSILQMDLWRKDPVYAFILTAKIWA